MKASLNINKQNQGKNCTIQNKECFVVRFDKLNPLVKLNNL